MKLTPIEDALISAGSGAAVIGGAAKVHAGMRRRLRKWREQRMYNRGVKGVPGVFDSVPGGAVRTAALEEEVRHVKIAVAAVDTKLDARFDALTARIDRLFPNGEDTNDTGDLISRMARSVGAYREDVGHNHT
jgi:hypothetical protein